MVEKVEFGDRTSAKQIRQNPKFKPFIADSDDARKATVELKENVPDRALQDISGEAADSLRHKAEEYGQAELSRSEKKRLDFTETNVMHARSAKAIAQGKGVDDWTSFYDPQLSVDEHRGVFESAKKDDRGRRGLGRDPNSEALQADRQARAHQQRQQGELPNAKRYAFQGDRDAQSFVQERVDEPGGSFGDVFDMSFSRTDDGRLQGSGRDFERLEERHEERSQRARTLDEKRTAQVTRNPFEWLNAPGRYDYPGIDTVQPAELNEKRSAHARAMDERDVAPIAPSKEAWAMHPGRYDWKGVDDVDPEAFEASRSQRARTIDEREIAPQADSKQQWARHPGRYDWKKVDAPDSYGPLGSAPIPEEERGRGPSLSSPSLADVDVSLSPEEAFEGVGAESQTSGSIGWGLAGGEEADMAFLAAEEERANDFGAADFDAGNPINEAQGLGLVDDRDQQGSMLDFGMETDATQHRDVRDAVEQATTFGIDDRSEASRGSGNDVDEGEQQGFELFGGGLRENQGLDSF